MKLQHPDEWYGPAAALLNRHSDYSLVRYQCDGMGICMDYPLFSGIDLVFMDFNCTDTFYETVPDRDILDIRHFRQGRIEIELPNQRVLHMREGEFCVDAPSGTLASCSFPFGRCSGVSFLIDRDSVDDAAVHQMRMYGIDVKTLGRALELDLRWYIRETPPQLSRIFSELYEAKGKESLAYFRIKGLELLYQIQKLRTENSDSPSYYTKAQILIVKQIWKRMIEDLEVRLPLKELISEANISMVTFQAVFRQIYGDSPYAHLRKYKMNCAAVRLRGSNESISRIAVSLGYNNASKFSKAFQDVFGVLPGNYRRQNQSI